MSKEFDDLSSAYSLIPIFESGTVMRRMGSEIRQKIGKKIAEIIKTSSTTGFYKETLPKLAQMVYDQGKRVPPSDKNKEFIEALQLNDPQRLGIFDRNLAAKGETSLFISVLQDFLSNIQYELVNGHDPDGSIGSNADDARVSTYFPKKSMTEMKNYMLEWQKAYSKNYKKPILTRS